MILESQAPVKSGSLKTGLMMIFCLLVGLGVVLYHKFSGNDPAWAQWQHLALKQEVVLGQSPGLPKEQPSAQSSSVPPLWSLEQPEAKEPTAPRGRNAASKANAIEMQLLGHEEPASVRMAAKPSGTPGFLPTNSARQLAQAETPRSLFDDSTELPHERPQPARHSAAAMEAPSQHESELADPFAAAAAPPERPVHRGQIQRTDGGPTADLPQVDALSIDSFPEPVKPKSNALPPLEPMKPAHSVPPSGLSPLEPMQQLPPANRNLPPVQSMPLEIEPFQQSPSTRPAAAPTQNFMPMEDSHPIPSSAPPARSPQGNHAPSQFAPPVRSASPAQQFNTTSQPLSDPTPSDDVYQVQNGDNYWTISRRFYSSARFFSALAEYNKSRIPDASKMKPGMYVLVPPVEVLHQRYAHLTGGGPRDPNLSLPPGFFIDQSGQPSYRVGEGDTLSDIAQHHLGRGSRWVQIYGMNKDKIPDGKTLKIGSVLILPADASQVVVVPTNHEIR